MTVIETSSSTEQQQQQPLRDTTRILLTKAKEASPVVKFGLEKLSALWASQPVSSQVQNIANPLLNTVDAQLIRAYQALPQYRHLAEDSLVRAKTQWFLRVDQILTKAKALDVQHVVPNTITTTTAEVKQSIQAFYTTSVDHFLVLAKAKLTIQVSNGDNNTNTELTRDEFISGLKNKLKHVWDDSLVAPAEQFYERAKTLYVDHIGTKVNALTTTTTTTVTNADGTIETTTTSPYLTFLTNLRQQLDSQWEQKVMTGLYPYTTSMIHTRIEQPAKFIYTSALQHYLALYDNKQVVKATEFITSYRSKLGATWNHQLEQPIRELLTSFKTSRQEDLHKLYHVLDNHNKGFLTLSDFLGIGNNVINGATSTVETQWKGLLAYSLTTFDAIVPETQEENESKQKQAADITIPSTTESTTLTNVATHVTKRLRDRTTDVYTTMRKRAATNVDYVKTSAQSRIVTARQFGVDNFDLVRKFSSQRLAPLIHIDIVNVAEDLLNKQAKPAYDHVTIKLEHANQQVKIQLEQLQTTLAEITTKAKSRIPVDAVQTQWINMKSATSSVTLPVQQSISTATSKLPITELKRKLRDTILNAKALTYTSSEYALNRQLSLIPSDLLNLLSQTRRIFLTPSSSSTSPHSSTHSSPIASPISPSTSPSPLTDDTQDIELVIVKIQGVVSAIKELFHWSNIQQASEEQQLDGDQEKENQEQQIKSKMDVDAQ